MISGCLVCKKLKACKNFSLDKTHMGNGKMIEAIINSIEEGRLPFPGEIVKYVESYMNSIERKEIISCINPLTNNEPDKN